MQTEYSAIPLSRQENSPRGQAPVAESSSNSPRDQAVDSSLLTAPTEVAVESGVGSRSSSFRNLFVPFFLYNKLDCSWLYSF